MHKEFIYVGRNIIVEDEKGNKTIRENSDNLEEILKQENVIELIENTINELKEEINYYEKKSLKKFIPYMLISLPIFDIVLYFTIGNMYLSNFGTINSFIKCSLATTLALSPLVCAEIISYVHYKSAKKIIKGCKNQLDFLEKQLEKEKEILIELKNKEKRIKQEKEFKTPKIEPSKKIEKLEDNYSMYYDLGFNEDRYLRYFQKGNIDRLLQEKEYNDEQIEVAHLYLESKAKTLIRKRK